MISPWMNAPQPLWQHLLSTLDWSSCDFDGEPDEVTACVLDVIGAGDQSDPDRAAAVLEELIGHSCDEAYRGAELVAEVLLAALPTTTDARIKARVLRLLGNVAGPNCDPNDRAAGPFQRTVGSGIWLYYGLINDEDAGVRQYAIGLVGWADPNRPRVARILDYVAATDPDEKLRAGAEKVKLNYRGRPSYG